VENNILQQQIVYFVETSKGAFIPMKQEQLSNNKISQIILFKLLANYN